MIKAADNMNNNVASIGRAGLTITLSGQGAAVTARGDVSPSLTAVSPAESACSRTRISRVG